jgi:hypothetical protein
MEIFKDSKQTKREEEERRGIAYILSASQLLCAMAKVVWTQLE